MALAWAPTIMSDGRATDYKAEDDVFFVWQRSVGAFVSVLKNREALLHVDATA